MKDPALREAGRGVRREPVHLQEPTRPAVSRLIAVTATILFFAMVASILLILFVLVSGYGFAQVPFLPPGFAEFVGFTLLVLLPIALIALCGAMVARWSSGTPFKSRVRKSIRTRLMVSHLVAVTASTFIYAAGGFVLLILLLIYSGYTWRELPFLLPEFAGITLFVLLQIGLITLCGVIVARWASGYLSRRIVRQIGELEAATEEFALGRLDRRVRVLAPDELGRLAERFNLLASQLDELDRQRRAFVANISHDLRTPIAIIRGHIDAHLHRSGTEDADPLDPQASFAAIERETEKLGKLIDDLFTLSRVEEGVLPVARLPVALRPLVEQTVEGVRPYALSTSRVSVHAEVPEDVPPVLGDRVRIAQIMGNLVHNAVRHTPAGGVVMLRAGAVPTGEVEISVEDTGVGISPEDLPHIFDRFYQGESVRESGGTGLGLSIVKQLVEIQGGSVSATSRPGEGTRIAFRLPAAPPGG